MSNNSSKTSNFRKWIKIIRDHSALVGTDGQINPREEDISDDHVYYFVNGGPIKIAMIAARNKRKHLK